ncbi:MAG: CidA/LrgA family protein [Pelagibacteraceae bacterium]|jgi:holin-like protein|uniref:CidA/LrgA family protein n=1 Tax=Pelagibacter sp. (strain IMCC9063) TaxID=1002672 RepID=UPI0002046892|nr:CidA/LrgA family protein [Candidatus Pelagibacter sp. IMCC9063]AEA81027.1 antiholin-like protein LrgA [Candidatus Pelagibacter sp. IMCC9063]|tara:strand:+ start:147 stop:530 length:384 start_codon:yes stop_codon:yes gene_type:complete
MLKSIFIIFLFQLIGESVQKYFELTIPGPVIGLILLLISFILLKNSKNIFVNKAKNEIVSTATHISNYLSLLFVPIGVGVVMHLSYLEKNYIEVLGVIFFSTILTIGFTALVMEAINNRFKKNDRKK